MSTVTAGNPVTLDALFSAADQPSPDVVTFTVQAPDDSTVTYVSGTDSEVTNPTGDYWECAIGVPTDVGEYRWSAVGTAGSTEEVTETIYGTVFVLQSAVDPEASDPPGPMLGPCTTWITGEDVAACARFDYGSSPAVFDTVAWEASMALYEISNRTFPGLCERLVRPCRTGCGCWGAPVSSGFQPFLWGAYGLGGAWGWQNERGDRCGCAPMSVVELAGYPVREILEVLIGGVALPEFDPVTGARNWRLDKWRQLVRMDTPGSPPQPNVWPGCFAAGTLVLTDRGLQPIEEVKVGDRVLTHRNRWRKVTWAGQTRDSATVTVAGRGGKIVCTPDHPILAARVLTRAGKGTSGWQPAEHEWVEAADLEGCAWSTPSAAEALPIPMPFDAVPPNFWWFVGRWVGDGWTDTANRVTICSGLHEREELAEALAATGWQWRESGGSAGGAHDNARFRFNSAALTRWLREQFGTSAHDKRIPSWMLGAPEGVRRDFLEGYVSADGWRGRASNGHGRPYTSVHTVSRKLALGTRLLVATLGQSAIVYEGHAGSDPRTTTYRINWPESMPGEPWSQSRSTGDHLLGRVKNVEHGRVIVPVYDLTVEDDHSFVADGIVVHNCQNLSLDDDQPGTFSIRYKWGTTPPQLGRDAAVELALQLYLACGGGGGECVLPAGVTKVIRQEVTIERSLLANWLDPKKPTGLLGVDTFLQAYAQGMRSGRRNAIWSPDVQQRARAVGTDYSRPA